MVNTEFEIKCLKPKDEKRWNQFVMKNDSTTFYHQIGWKNAIQETYGHKPYYLFAENETGEIAGIFPLSYKNSPFVGKCLVSVAFAPYGGVCSDDDLVKKALIDETIELGKKLDVDYCEFRCLEEIDTHRNMGHIRNHSAFHLDISKGHEYIWDNMNRNVRNRIRKGEKSNLKYEMDSNSDSIFTFYDIYARTMKLLGTPVHDIKLFKNLLEQFPDNIFIAKANLDDRTVSAFYCLKFKDMLITAWGQSLHEYLKFAPNNFMYWNCVKHASENNLLRVDFGRSLVNSGHHTFKARWGCTEVPLNYYFYPPSKIVLPYLKYEKFTKFWNELPLSVVNKIGPKIRGEIP